MEWISVKDRLPEIPEGKEDSLPVLCLIKDGHHEDAILSDYGDGPFWYYVQDREFTEYVTHWMPLPKPPEK